jgi:Raf kinase inhibitor-like YbhB/YbcL family protein
MRPLLALVVLVGCGGNEPASPDASADSPTDGIVYDEPGIPGTFTLTSPTITEGGVIPPTHVCASKGGQNQSPQLVFTNVPQGTQSFAVVLTDLSNSLVHCAIYDVPGTDTGLPANVATGYTTTTVPGAHQTLNISGARAYAGPCPPNTHTYQFKVYALATATLPNAVMGTTKETVVSTASASNLGTATLTGTFTPP